MEVTYKVAATSVGGREGHVKSSDGIVDMNLVYPVEMGGKGGGANPETLFAAGYSACFNGALHLAARMKKIEIGEPEVTVEIMLGKDEAGGGLKLAANITITVKGVSQADADALIAKTHTICPYSKATMGNIDVKLKAIVK